jgi:hypothetical protein
MLKVLIMAAIIAVCVAPAQAKGHRHHHNRSSYHVMMYGGTDPPRSAIWETPSWAIDPPPLFRRNGLLIDGIPGN